MRKQIDIVETGMVMKGRAVDGPPEYDKNDDPHYDALAKTGFFGNQAAGCVFFARSTGRVMLMLRSAGVLEPGTWGNCGGAHHADEEPINAAEREGREETGYRGDMTMYAAYVFKKPEFVYHNFFAVVDDEFEPTLNWEADDFRWVSRDELPAPLHFGMQSLFADPETKNLLGRLGAP